MIILQPHLCDLDKDNKYTTFAHFHGGHVRKFYFRGAIAWPQGTEEGFALLAGQDLDTKHIIIFKQYPFWTIDNWLKPDGNIYTREDGKGYYTGLLEFIADNLAHFKCASYFWGDQHIEYYQRFAKEVYQNPQASRRIELIEVPYVHENGPSLLLEKLRTEKFSGEVDTILEKSLSMFTGMQTTKADYDNPVRALMTLLAGFEFQPWVDIRS